MGDKPMCLLQRAHRRSALSLAAAGPLLLLPQWCKDAQAAVSGYEPMEALKGKDYGKARMT